MARLYPVLLGFMLFCGLTAFSQIHNSTVPSAQGIKAPNAPQTPKFAPIQLDHQRSEIQNSTQTDNPTPRSLDDDNINHAGSLPLRVSPFRKEAISISLSRIINEESKITSRLPAASDAVGSHWYRKAQDELVKMLEGKEDLDIKRAVFLVENAWYEGCFRYEDYENSISGMANDCLSLLKQKGLDPRREGLRNMAIFRYLSDTTEVVSDGKTIQHLPLQYDFDDYLGYEDWTKMFVLKLLKTGSGQCHSMPLLYKILAEELGVSAYLAYGPSHLYVKIPVGENRFQNIELTNGRFTSDNYILASGFVTAEAIQSGIYLDTLGNREVVALCLYDLAKGYSIKYGYDRFVFDATNTVLEYHPTNIFALTLKSDFLTLWCQHEVKKAGNPSLSEVQQSYPEINEIHRQMMSLYKLIDATGYKSIPEKAYAKWLNPEPRNKH